MKFIIFSPKQGNGGSIVLHLLCKKIQEQGYDARIFYSGQTLYMKGTKIKFWIRTILGTIRDLIKEVFILKRKNETITGCRRCFFPINRRNTITIYPDVVFGNPFYAKRVVRWLLYYNRYAESNQAYGEDDVFFCYREVFNDKKLNPDCKMLNISYYDLELYHRYNYDQRKGCCYIIRKGKNRDDLPSCFDGPIIDDYSEKEKVVALNTYKYCISYDMQTSYSSIAAICGCISIVVPEAGKDKDYYFHGEDCLTGVAFGFDKEEIKKAEKEMNSVIDCLSEKNQNADESVKAFCHFCKTHFNI